MFGPLAVSLSIISPVQHPTFEVIFNMGNNGSPVANTPISNIKIGELNVLLSRNFKEAHDALRGKRRVDPATKESVESMNMTDDIGLPTDFSIDNEEVGSMVDPRGASPADSSMFLHSSGNILNNTQPYLSPPILPYASSSSSCSRLPFLVAGFDKYGRPVFGPGSGVPFPPITPQFNPRDFWPPPPSSTYSQNLVQAWEGTLVGKTNKNRSNTQRGKALRRATSPSTLTSEWSRRLDISFYLPEKTLDYTITIYRDPIDYVFFNILHFNNLELYEHLKNKNLCAKINLPFQTLILSPTRNRHYYIGTVFPKDVTFIQMN